MKQAKIVCGRDVFGKITMARYSHLPIFQKSYELIKWIYFCVSKFSKAEKYALGQKIKQTAMDFLDRIIRANGARDKTPDLEEAAQLLEILRIYIRLSYDLSLINLKRYELLSGKIDEIGRMLGGWRRSNV
jgi:four helix bundle protein